MIKMAVGKNSNETVHLVPGNLDMQQDPNMHMFQIKEWNLDYYKPGGLRVLIVLRRKVTSELMTTYFPSFLLLAITLATTFFKPFFFEAALSVNLTTMLVMTTIFISKMESLPPTSDIKMIDLWLVFCQIIPFAEVVLLTTMEYHRSSEEGHDLENSQCVSEKMIVQEEIEANTEKWYQRITLQLFIPSLKNLGDVQS